MDQVLPHDDSVDRFARERIIIQNKDEANAFADFFSFVEKKPKRKIKSTHWNVYAQYVCMIRFLYLVFK